jgi:hypothetical protein
MCVRRAPLSSPRYYTSDNMTRGEIDTSSERDIGTTSRGSRGIRWDIEVCV